MRSDLHDSPAAGAPKQALRGGAGQRWRINIRGRDRENGAVYCRVHAHEDAACGRSVWAMQPGDKGRRLRIPLPIRKERDEDDHNSGCGDNDQAGGPTIAGLDLVQAFMVAMCHWDGVPPNTCAGRRLGAESCALSPKEIGGKEFGLSDPEKEKKKAHSCK